jgi:hypothetical protein
MSQIADFTETELDVVRDALEHRLGHKLEPDLVDTELRLSPEARELTPCPALYWEIGACRFLLAKTGAASYRTLFFYGANEQYGTGIEEYSDLNDCVLTVLRLQADHESTRQEAAPGGLREHH